MIFSMRNFLISLPLIMVPQTLLAAEQSIESLTITASRQAQESNNLSLTAIKNVNDVK